MQRPLTETDTHAAATLLAEGFPSRPLAFWREGLRRLFGYGDNAAANVPWGWMSFDAQTPVGVVLTPAGQRFGPDGRARTIVNLSSWYLRPGHRWRSAQMLRTVVADPAPVYIDVSAGADVGRMLQLLGFAAIGVGTAIALLPAHALRPARPARVRELAASDTLPPGTPSRQQVSRHRELACVPLLLEHAQGQTLLVYRRRRLRGLPAAHLYYVGSHAVLHSHLATVARYLLAKGLALLMWDRRAGSPTSHLSLERPGGVWYARGDSFEDRTDFLGSELCILNI